MSAVPNSITPIVVKQIEIAGVPFETADHTDRCFTLMSLRTGKVVQFTTRAARAEFMVGLEWHISHKRAMEAQAAADWTWSFKADRLRTV